MPHRPQPGRNKRAPALDLPSGALFSDCGRYRYLLWRRWGPGQLVLFVGLNPNRADAVRDDPTIRRMAGFARAWGYAGILVANLFAARAPTPARLHRLRSPVGPGNDDWLDWAGRRAGLNVACWGNHGGWLGRDRQVWNRGRDWHVFRFNRTGCPAHPLYLPGDLKPVPVRGP